MSQLEEVWNDREETIYRELFGDIGRGIYPLSAETFLTTFKQEDIDPTWLFYGVFESPPHPQRNSWLYVSSGMSNPWDWDDEADEDSQVGNDELNTDTNEYSGMGAEFVMETKERAPWAIVILQRMVAYNILLSCGRMGHYPPLNYGDRIPLRGSVALDKESAIQNLVIAMPEHYPQQFILASGKVDLLHFIGVTDAELQYAKQTSSSTLIEMLKQQKVYPFTDPDRQSIDLVL